MTSEFTSPGTSRDDEHVYISLCNFVYSYLVLQRVEKCDPRRFVKDPNTNPIIKRSMVAARGQETMAVNACTCIRVWAVTCTYIYLAL